MPLNNPDDHLPINKSRPCLARFMAKCYRRNWRCDADSGSDVEGEKPIVIVLENFNEAIKNNKLVEALAEGRRLIGRSGTLLYRDHLVNINKNKIVKSIIDNAGIESIYSQRWNLSMPSVPAAV